MNLLDILAETPTKPSTFKKVEAFPIKNDYRPGHFAKLPALLAPIGPCVIVDGMVVKAFTTPEEAHAAAAVLIALKALARG